MTCTRHRFKVVRAGALRKKSAGHPSAYWGVWEIRKCEHCDAESGRWAQGVHLAESARNALAQYELLKQHRPAPAPSAPRVRRAAAAAPAPAATWPFPVSAHDWGSA